jgi:hypothetical protein
MANSLVSFLVAHYSAFGCWPPLKSGIEFRCKRPEVIGMMSQAIFTLLAGE